MIKPNNLYGGGARDSSFNRINVVVGIGANIPERKYPIEKYLEALKKIINKGANVIIVGGPSEIEDSNFLQENLPSEFVKNLVPLKLNWRVTAAVIAQTHLYIGNDTGTAHCAAAAHVPIILLSRQSKELERNLSPAPSEGMLYFPYQVNVIRLQPDHQIDDCRKYNLHAGCMAGKSHCIAQIKPNEIVSAFDTMIKFLNHSGIENNSFPPVIRNGNQIFNFYSNPDQQ